MSVEKYQQSAAAPTDDSTSSTDASRVETPIEFLSDVTLEVAVEFGRTTLSVGELLKLKKGSVISFDKEKDSGMEFLVNGNAVASGEVVVVNENYGIRITSIKDPHFFDEGT